MRLLLIAALEAQHLYSVYTRDLCERLCEHGQDAQVFDYLKHPDGLGAALAEGGHEAVISFGSFFGAMTVGDGVSAYDLLGARFLGWHFDHPVYLGHLICNPMAGRRIVHAQPDHQRFAEAAGVEAAHAVMAPGAQPPVAAPKDHARRSMDVFVAATWNGEPQPSWETWDDSPAKRITVAVADRLLQDRNVSVLDAFRQACATLGYGGLKLDKNIFPLLGAPLSYVRHLDRLQAVRELADSGLPLTVCGSGWEQLLADRRNVRLLPSRPFEATHALYGDARISINLNAANGGCERAVNAMLAGSCVASDFGETLAQSFGPGEIRFFERRGLHGISGVVADLLEGGQAEAIAARGHAKAMATMLWSHRIDPLLKLLG